MYLICPLVVNRAAIPASKLERQGSGGDERRTHYFNIHTYSFQSFRSDLIKLGRQEKRTTP